MLLHRQINVVPAGISSLRSKKVSADRRATSCRPTYNLRASKALVSNEEDAIEKLRKKHFHGEIEITPSSYDTAWVAMVPSMEYSSKPRFPQCLEWIMKNQNPDGSWGLLSHQPSGSLVIKDSLSCTLACLLALRKWNLGHQLVHKGLDFIGSNMWAVSDKSQHNPIGFEIVFPGMVDFAGQLNLTLPFNPLLINNLIHLRESEILRRKRNLDYVAEGVGEWCDWKEILSRQRSNGSICNSPATTAAALIHSHDDKCLRYLLSVLTKFQNYVPAAHPMEICTRLCVVDTLERLGIEQHFQSEIRTLLEETYRLWQQKDEAVFADITCRAMAFRHLRVHSYKVSSEEFAEFIDGEHFIDAVSIQYTNVTTILELYEASKLKIYEEDSVLEKIQSWTGTFLKKQLQKGMILDPQLAKQIQNSLKSFASMSARVQNKVYIELYDVNQIQILKTAYRCRNINNDEIHQFSRQHFNICQAQYQEDLRKLNRWYANTKLEDCRIGRHLPHEHIIFQAAELFPDPFLSDARVCYAQAVYLIANQDDFFDSSATEDEVLKFIELVNQWGIDPAATYSSPRAEILFKAIYDSINEWAEKAAIVQGRCVKPTLIRKWRKLVKSFAKERDLMNKHKVITLDEYLSVARDSIAVAVVDSITYLLGEKISEDMWNDADCISMQEHSSTVLRLLNDTKTYKKEKRENAINSLSVLISQTHGAISEEEALLQLQQIIEDETTKLRRMFLGTKESRVSKQYKDLIWKFTATGFYIYADSDEFSCPKDMLKDANTVIQQPLVLPP